MKTLARVALVLVGVASPLFSAGCWYDRPNPWNTERDAQAFRDKTEADWNLELRETWEAPQARGAGLTLPDLEGWRDSVLLNADAKVLAYMRDQSARKIAALESRAYSMAPLNESNKEQIYQLWWQSRVEKIRLQYIDQRLGESGR